MNKQRAKQIILFTNRNTLVFDRDGKQMGKYQKAISSSRINKAVARLAIQEASGFYIAKWMGWQHEITREEMARLLGIPLSKEGR